MDRRVKTKQELGIVEPIPRERRGARWLTFKDGKLVDFGEIAPPEVVQRCKGGLKGVKHVSEIWPKQPVDNKAPRKPRKLLPKRPSVVHYLDFRILDAVVAGDDKSKSRLVKALREMARHDVPLRPADVLELANLIEADKFPLRRGQHKTPRIGKAEMDVRNAADLVKIHMRYLRAKGMSNRDGVREKAIAYALNLSEVNDVPVNEQSLRNYLSRSKRRAPRR